MTLAIITPNKSFNVDCQNAYFVLLVSSPLCSQLIQTLCVKNKMKEFCGCNNPHIETIEEGMTIVISCTNCGQSVATTNTNKLLEENPWLNDLAEYEIHLDRKAAEKKIYIEILKRFNKISTSEALNLYKENSEILIYKGKGQEFYENCLYLNEAKAKYKTIPYCNYVKNT